MSLLSAHRLRRPETLVAIGLVLAAGGLLLPATALPPLSALLPATMLAALLVLGTIMLVRDQRRAAAGAAPTPLARSPGRVLGAFALILLYALAVDGIGFYPATALAVPLIAAAFGYRSPLGLALATLLVLSGIWLLFDFVMDQSFPTGRFWSM